MDRIHRFVFEHRRLLAAAFTGLAVLGGLAAVRDTPDGTHVLVASRDLPSGRVITSADVRVAQVPPGSAPTHGTARADTVGRRVAGPMREGEPFTDYRVLRPDSLAGYGHGAVLTTVRVDELDGLTGVHVGDRVDVVAVDPDGESEVEVVARDVEVVTVPAPSQDRGGNPLGIVTTEKTALSLASAALESRFSIIASAS